MNRFPRGMTLIDVLVGSAIMLVIFLGIVGLLRASATLGTLSTETAAANAIAESQMEYIRSLPYASVGTVGGIPTGDIAQDSTTTEDGIDYGVRTFIDYYDDPADGTGSADTNGITTDYKRAKVSVSFTTTTGTKSVTLVSDVAPPGIESTTGGGTLQIHVVNSAGSALAGASVTITNANTSPAVNLTTLSDSTGLVSFPGAATSTGYHITVTEAGYSTAQTYDRDTNNQNPNPGHLTVVANQTTSGTFAIDQLASFTIGTYTPIASSTFSDQFSDGSELSASSNTSVAGGALTLAGDGSGGYLTPGSALSIQIAPSYLANWGTVSATLSAPAGTTALVHVTDGSGTLIPDSALPGNSAGFSSFPVNLFSLSTTTYPALELRADLTGGTSAPSVFNWALTYAAGPLPLPNVAFTLTGAKTIGSTGSGAPIYKTVISTTTGSTGLSTLSLEWDSYSLSISGHTISTTSPTLPFQVFAGASTTASIILSP